MEKEEKLKNIQKKINSMHIGTKFFVEQFGLIFLFFLIYTPIIFEKLFKYNSINFITAMLLLLPGVVITALLPNILVNKRENKLIKLEQEEQVIVKEMVEEKIRYKISNMSYAEKKKYLTTINSSKEKEDYYDLSDKQLHKIVHIIMKDVEQENSNISNFNIKSKTISPIDRTYEQIACKSHVKKLHI